MSRASRSVDEIEHVGKSKPGKSIMIWETWIGRAGRRFDASGNVPVFLSNQWDTLFSGVTGKSS